MDHLAKAIHLLQQWRIRTRKWCHVCCNALAKQHLREMWMAEIKQDAEKVFDFFLKAYGAKFDNAVA